MEINYILHWLTYLVHCITFSIAFFFHVALHSCLLGCQCKYITLHSELHPLDLSDVASYVAIHITLHFTSYYILNHITFHVACLGSAWRRILLPALEPLSPVRSQGPKVVQSGGDGELPPHCEKKKNNC